MLWKAARPFFDFFFIFLDRNCEGINMKLIHKVALKVLDISYLLKDRLQDMLKYASENDEDSAKRRIVSNQFLLATCALVAACYIIDSSSNDMVRASRFFCR